MWVSAPHQQWPILQSENRSFIMCYVCSSIRSPNLVHRHLNMGHPFVPGVYRTTLTTSFIRYEKQVFGFKIWCIWDILNMQLQILLITQQSVNTAQVIAFYCNATHFSELVQDQKFYFNGTKMTSNWYPHNHVTTLQQTKITDHAML